jgi:hypothetical protein
MRKKQAENKAVFTYKLSALGGGWGGRIRTSVWRNQNPLDYPMISTRIWKKRRRHAPAVSIAWQPFPNETGFAMRKFQAVG